MTTKKTTTKKRGSGEGSWQRLANNKWKVTITVGFNVDGKQIRKSKTGTKKECQEWVKSQSNSTSNDYFYDYALKWLELKKQSIRRGTVINSETAINAIARINNFKISKVNDFIVSNIVSGLQKILKTSTLNKYLNTLSLILKYAFFQGHINKLPYIPKIKDDTIKNIQVLSYDEIQSVLKKAKIVSPHFLYPVLILGFFTGMRLGEILSLNKSDVNLEEQTININKTQEPSAGSIKMIIRSGAKTKSSNRIIKVQKDVLEEVLNHVQKNNSPYLISHHNRFYSSTTASKTISDFFTSIGYPNMTMHKTRHSFVSMMLQQQASLVEVSKYVGHSNVNVTSDIYTHLDLTKVKTPHLIK